MMNMVNENSTNLTETRDARKVSRESQRQQVNRLAEPKIVMDGPIINH